MWIKWNGTACKLCSIQCKNWKHFISISVYACFSTVTKLVKTTAKVLILTRVYFFSIIFFLKLKWVCFFFTMRNRLPNKKIFKIELPLQKCNCLKCEEWKKSIHSDTCNYVYTFSTSIFKMLTKKNEIIIEAKWNQKKTISAKMNKKSNIWNATSSLRNRSAIQM